MTIDLFRLFFIFISKKVDFFAFLPLLNIKILPKIYASGRKWEKVECFSEVTNTTLTKKEDW